MICYSYRRPTFLQICFESVNRCRHVSMGVWSHQGADPSKTTSPLEVASTRVSTQNQLDRHKRERACHHSLPPLFNCVCMCECAALMCCCCCCCCCCSRSLSRSHYRSHSSSRSHSRSCSCFFADSTCHQPVMAASSL